MNQIIGVKMPADKAINIIKTMTSSNLMVEIKIIFHYAKDGVKRDQDWKIIGNKAGILIPERRLHDEKTDTLLLLENITINSITQIIPTYSIGDRVLILSTGEIVSITGIDDENVRSRYKTDKKKKAGNGSHFNCSFHRSEIAKLPNDLSLDNT